MLIIMAKDVHPQAQNRRAPFKLRSWQRILRTRHKLGMEYANYGYGLDQDSVTNGGFFTMMDSQKRAAECSYQSPPYVDLLCKAEPSIVTYDCVCHGTLSPRFENPTAATFCLVY